MSHPVEELAMDLVLDLACKACSINYYVVSFYFERVIVVASESVGEVICTRDVGCNWLDRSISSNADGSTGLNWLNVKWCCYYDYKKQRQHCSTQCFCHSVLPIFRYI